jgi:hypothetical protein
MTCARIPDKIHFDTYDIPCQVVDLKSTMLELLNQLKVIVATNRIRSGHKGKSRVAQSQG